MTFIAAVLLAGVLAGGIASIAGFGIGSVLTPLLAPHYGTKVAVAAIAVPHALGTALRFYSLRGHVNRQVFIRFGVLSAAGGLVGAFLHSRLESRALTAVFAALLLFAGGSTLTGFAQRMHFGRTAAWIAGGVSGLFGGLVGNQGGIRSAALLGFDLPREQFVATATGIGLIVDGARLPLYLDAQAPDLSRVWATIAVAALGVVAGTIWGVRILRRIPEAAFRRGVGALVLALGIYMLLRSIAPTH